LVRSIGLSITVCISVVWICALGILLCVGQTISIGVGVAVATVSWIKTVGNFPTVWESIAIRISVIHIGALRLFLCVGQTIAVPIGSTVGGVERVRTIGGSNTCTHSEHQGS
jgi:hypothetical protein